MFSFIQNKKYVDNDAPKRNFSSLVDRIQFEYKLKTLYKMNVKNKVDLPEFTRNELLLLSSKEYQIYLKYKKKNKGP